VSDGGRLRVLVNLTWLVPGVVGGSEESTTDALRAVLGTRPEVELQLAVLRPFLDAHPDLAAACRCEVLDLSGSSKVARVAAEQTWLARRARALRPDLVHHAGGVVPLVHPGCQTLTVHDLQPLDLPANFATRKRLYLRAMLGRSARVARAVCVPSRFTAGRLRALLGVEGSRVHVVPWSVTSPAPGPPGSAPGEDRSRPDPDQPMLLYPAITYPHKNHLVLLEAFAELRRDVPEARLVLPGGPGPCEAEVRARMARADLAGHVERPGRIERTRLEECYREATAVVVPSRYEGFGLPALEAMVRGVPVVVADAGALPEVVGTLPGAAPSPVDPDDVTGWAAAMQAVVDLDGARRREVVEAGLARAGRFSPSATADGLVAAWRHALAVP
jgi:alpha-1,3-rhamnosyl/mannosyltransferase